ncbi:MAG: response regulator [Phycisphaerales bacterium]
MNPVPAGPSILICDDEAPIRHVVRMRLEAAGYRVVEARTGVEGLEAATASPPVLVITDYQMPLMSGVEMAKRLCDNPETVDVPVVLVTARGYVLQPAELLGTSIRAVLGKPFGMRQLLEHVARLLPGSDARKVA